MNDFELMLIPIHKQIYMMITNKNPPSNKNKIERKLPLMKQLNTDCRLIK